MYPVDYRIATLQLYNYFQSMRKTSEALNVSIASISRWTKRLQPLHRKRKYIKLSDALVIFVQQLVNKDPSLKCSQLVILINDHFQLSVSRQLVHLVLKRLNYSYKRIRKRGISTKKQLLQEAFLRKFYNLPNDSNIISIDESGFDQRPIPIYGYSLKGKQAICNYNPSMERRRHSLLMAISNKGYQHYSIVKESVKSSTFQKFIESLDLPKGSYLLMDNASIHKSVFLKLYLQSKDCNIIFTPPYSPEYNPIELVFGFIKNDYYKSRYSSNFNIESSIQSSVSRVNHEHIINCFKHVNNLISHEFTNLQTI